ncbi:neurogenin-1-like [Paramacrobiotus metropolitanus]|uniref:neurogenin-1-like n=1 Tax=Paramacrobiotus metropolitanus TaxID=2943436 RepID=UPI002445DB63|nr:neurogenin-1-like [Paramacrobiotus metropolitanus]
MSQLHLSHHHHITHNHSDIKMEPMSPEADIVKSAASNVSATTTKSTSAVKPKRYSRPRGRCRSPTFVQKLKKTRRLKANDRERNRMHSLNNALERLRLILPQNPDESKLTKIETLRLSITYIEKLTQVLKASPGKDAGDQDMSYSAYNTEPHHSVYPAEEKALDVPHNFYPENLESLLSGMYPWPTSDCSPNTSWCSNESSEDSAMYNAGSNFQFDNSANVQNGLNCFQFM